MSGSKTKIQTLYTAALEKQKHVNFEEEDQSTLTGALKQALQSLPEPLFTFSRYEAFLDCASGNALSIVDTHSWPLTEKPTKIEQINAIQNELIHLPPSNLVACEALFDHLYR